MFPPVGGGTLARVVALTLADCAELLPAGSFAETAYVYGVDGDRPVSEYDGETDVPI
jgi:hypothetical protein